jgi:hypothetical protein
MAVAIVQSAVDTTAASNADPATVVFGATPTVGNLLIISFAYFDPVGPPSPPAGFTEIRKMEPTGCALVTYSRVVQGGDGTSYAFQTVGDDYASVIGYETSGQATVSFINQENTANNSATTHTTATVTPSVAGCLALAFVSGDEGSNGGADAATISAGWTIDRRGYPNFHALYGAHRDALTSDTVTGINTTVSNLHNSDNTSHILLIAPAAVAAGTTPLRMLMGMGT